MSLSMSRLPLHARRHPVSHVRTIPSPAVMAPAGDNQHAADGALATNVRVAPYTPQLVFDQLTVQDQQRRASQA
ncbi:unnamed protein product [Sphagnum balticum]